MFPSTFRTPTLTAPQVLHLHGGAFVIGAPPGGSRVAALLKQAGACVHSFDYPLAPAHPFPQAVESAYAVLAGMQPKRRCGPLFVAGEEAGGNLAAALALMARDRGGPMLAGQILLSPMLDVCVATASLRDARAGPVGCRWADGWRKYLPRASDATHPYATPGSAMRLAGLPRTLLLTSQDDPLRDETRAYAQRLRDEGVPVDELVLPFATGFPVAYRESGNEAPWAEALREPLRRFLNQDPCQP
ncbi:alpha/beta hydrolase fold domain-containing protein [Piscinibacter sp. XHJ-5]|uniref:alpha/beta hydrolase fold domain-containing protein n=1 Tax=Piscinibacter sp. XHJ-5 TaxID=3037797 RepID=UPI00245290DC|nr:alpha/beta hydrolase fold domain-containing protein [Piscinibacter sp. XHJ-5]